ncbi:hypothetical protein DICSQDRAFT_179669 [Dichomitus squalens LYAD-421 SS1]|uniref:uncharacterized protein n=1 Tax=Dichomitus squalens (strain LYAD-421) TaxID=732165 RepID=UPI00044116EC|nr:uncharacterized protein DICSQDRAFT_179669 [Dichomitus squalens LYAD-421 SS1]EJF63002.1 hypothetical protein DICSQDRAFT_179669 [Dichomitus squalens LYAD-421 SS1]
MYNNAPVVIKISQEIDDSEVEPSQHGTPRERCRSDPCLSSRLPGDAFIQREANGLAFKAVKAELEQIRKSLETPTSQHGDSKLSPTASVHNSPESSPKARRRSLLDMLPSAFNAAKTLREAAKKSEGPWRQPEPYEIMRAIERRDIMFLMEVRDRSFESLVKKSGDATPLIHAMRIEHTDMAIVLLGAFSRYINHLQDEDLQKPETKNMLKMLRTNLKIAIDFGLQKSQKDLMASFLQTLIMSEGDTWITLQAGDVAACLRMGTEGKPVHNAEAAVRSFATKNLGKADLIASLEDYVANATADLVMIAAWSSALQVINGEAIPTYYFARDDRVYRALVERLDRHKDELPKLGRRLRWQLRALRTHLEGRSRAYRAKVESLAKELDEGEGR